MSTQIFIVEGMSCKNCKAHVEKGIRMVEGIEEVIADHLTGQVKVTGNTINSEDIKVAVEKAGYRFKGTDKSSEPGSDLWLS